MPSVRRPFVVKLLAGAAWIAGALAAPAHAAPPSPPGPQDPVVDLRSGLIDRAKGGWPPSAAALQALIDKDFDMPAITRAVLGDHADAATPAQAARLSHALTLKLDVEIDRMRPPAADDGFTVIGVRPAAAGAMVVTTRTHPPTGAGSPSRPATTLWRVHLAHGQPRIIDIVRNGISEIQLQHDDFAGALSSRDLDGVITLFEQRAAGKPAQW